MPTYLIPKDTGRIALFSTVSNRLIADDLTDDEYIENELQDAVQQAYRLARAQVKRLHTEPIEHEYDYDFARAIDEETQREEAAAAAAADE